MNIPRLLTIILLSTYSNSTSVQNLLASLKFGQPRYTAEVNSIKLNDTYIYPLTMSSPDNCFGNNLLEVTEGQQIRVSASKQFILYVSTDFTENFYNLQQYYGDNLEDITFNAIILSKQEAPRNHTVSLPLKLKCKYNVHPYFRLKTYLNVNFYQGNLEEKYQFDILLVCAKSEQIKAFTNFYIPGYIVFWMMVNLVLQVYHNYPRGPEHFAVFFVYLIASVIVENDLLAYFICGIIHFFIVLKERKRHAINNKMFSLYVFFAIIVALQIVLTFEGGKDHQLWNSFWIALDNFIILHISMFLALRLLKLSRFRHVFWYFVVVSAFSLLNRSHNRFFQIQFKNPLNLSCIKVQLFFPIMMLPISNFYTSITSWMHRVIGLGIIIVSVLPLEIGIKLTAFLLWAILCFQIYKKNVMVLRHRC